MAGDSMSPSAGEPSNAAMPSADSLRARLRDRPGRQHWLRRVWANKRQRWTAMAIVGLFIVSFFAGIAWYWSHRDASGGEHDYVEVYVTDLPANFSKLEVRLAGVYVGDPNYTLQLLTPRFDLLSLQGPEDALKVAAGRIPAGDHHAVRVVFQSARALLNGAWVSLQLPDQMLTIHHDFNTVQNPSSAFLFDIDVEESVRVENGGLVFRPYVDAIYHHSYETGDVKQIATGAPGSSLPPAFGTPDFGGPGVPPKDQDLGKPSDRLRPSATPSSSTPNSKFTWSPGEPTRTVTVTQSPTASTSDSTGFPVNTPATETSGYLPQPGDAASVPEDPTNIGGWFVRFKPTLQLAGDMVDALERSWDGQLGAPPELVFTFASEAAAYVFATPEQAWRMSMDPDVEYVEPDRQVVMNLATSRAAIQLPQVQDPVLGLRDGQGRALDGRGVGVAVIDVGIDGTHLDLPHRTVRPTDPLLLSNFKVESLFTVDVPTTDTTSGHGTHVVGILAGRGVADPSQKGVAPGVKIYGFGIGEAGTTLWPNTALDWIVQNHDKVDPPIRLVQNSWGSGNAYDPNSLTTRLVNRLIDAGVVVVFSAGNSGGDGSLAATTSQCQIPKPGLVCVAAFDDQGLGVRDGAIAPYSSRGRASDPQSWPDLSAPGTAIRSARPVAGAITGLGLPNSYTVLSGTSMAAPHVSGVVALMLQARPELSPSQVEAILEQTAYKFASGGAYNAAGTHLAKGHGLLDAYAAISLAKQY